ncbi:hypothetical protein [Aureibacter tunicatorum]|uniref:Uncharacterized protein n=1 Tax=Aureibacter tunicatorum TaxID=866807 RepID=A0AAE3XQB4_9BACT|nr:hypothetical protein [Aureibacter tunicatorum]MDR6240622.1 hypothetical protein [Aureibacter tunicatorum]BDD06517.1 hypothetical protein AUTU_40000 [Aureibacter tunicatorum]
MLELLHKKTSQRVNASSQKGISKLPPTPAQCLMSSKTLERKARQKATKPIASPLVDSLLPANSSSPDRYFDPLIYYLTRALRNYEQIVAKEDLVLRQVDPNVELRVLRPQQAVFITHQKLELLDQMEHLAYRWFSRHPIKAEEGQNPIQSLIRTLLRELSDEHREVVKDIVLYQSNPWLYDEESLSLEKKQEANLLWKMLIQAGQGMRMAIPFHPDDHYVFGEVKDLQAEHLHAIFAKLISRKYGRRLLKTLAWRPNNRAIGHRMLEDDSLASIETRKKRIRPNRHFKEGYFQAEVAFPNKPDDGITIPMDPLWSPGSKTIFEKHEQYTDPSGTEWIELGDAIPQTRSEEHLTLHPLFIQYANALHKAIDIHSAFPKLSSSTADDMDTASLGTREDLLHLADQENKIRREHFLPERRNTEKGDIPLKANARGDFTSRF